MRISDWSSDVCSSDLPAEQNAASTHGIGNPPLPLCRTRTVEIPALGFLEIAVEIALILHTQCHRQQLLNSAGPPPRGARPSRALAVLRRAAPLGAGDRKSTRLNSSH